MSDAQLRQRLLTALLTGEGTALELAERVTGERDVAPVGLCIVLEAMERDHLVSSSEGSNRPRIYRITPSGQQALGAKYPDGLPWPIRLFRWLIVATCTAGGLSAVGVSWAGPVSALLFALLLALALWLLWRLP